MIEVELKAPVPPERLAEVRARLGAPREVEAHEDVYFAHPLRDFATTDEALRLARRGARVELTYKGPKLDASSKARREVTLLVADAAAARALVEALGFAAVATVRKERSVHRVGDLDVALDVVPGLGAFVEVEKVVPDATPRGEVERAMRAFLATLGLVATERRSYLELLQASSTR